MTDLQMWSVTNTNVDIAHDKQNKNILKNRKKKKWFVKIKWVTKVKNKTYVKIKWVTKVKNKTYRVTVMAAMTAAGPKPTNRKLTPASKAR